MLSARSMTMLKSTGGSKESYEEVDRVLAARYRCQADLSAGPQTYLHHADSEEALRVATRARYGISPLKAETIGGKYKIKTNTLFCPSLALHADRQGLGPNPDALDPEN